MMRRSFVPSLAVVTCLCLLGLFCVFPGVSRATGGPDWDLLVRQGRAEIEEIESVLAQVEAELPADLAKSEERLDQLRSRFDQIQVLKVLAMVEGSPRMMAHLFKRLRFLDGETQDVLRPLIRAQVNIGKALVKLAQGKTQFGRLAVQSELAQVRDTAANLLRSLSTIEDRLRGFVARIEGAKARAEDLSAKVVEAQGDMRRDLTQEWIEFINQRAEPLYSPDLWRLMPRDMGAWLRVAGASLPTLGELRANATPSTTFFAALLLSLAAYLGLRRCAGSLAGRATPDQAARFSRGALLVSLGLLLQGMGTENASFLLDTTSGRAGDTCLSAGIILMAGAILRIFDPARRGRKGEPLWPLWFFVAAGGVFGILQLPESLAVPMKTLVLAGCVLAGWRMVGQVQGAGLKAAACAVALLLTVCLLLAGGGMANLAVVIAELLFLLCLSVLVSLALRSLILPWRDQFQAPLWQQGLASLLGLPAMFVGSTCALLWLFGHHTGVWYGLIRLANQEVDVTGLKVSMTGVMVMLTGFYLAKSLIFTLGTFIRLLPDSRPGVDKGMAESLRLIVRYAMWGAYVLGIMYYLGFSLASLAVVAGGLSVGLGFGLQQIVNNFISGLILLFGRGIQVGDILQIGEMRGVVRKIYIRNTVIQTLDNATMFIPNSELISGRIINWSHRDKRERINVTVGVAYGSDVELVTRTLLEAARQSPHTLDDPKPDVLFTSFGNSTLDFRLRVWVDKSGNADPAASHMHYAINRLFAEAGIEIAYPQTDLHIRSLPGQEKDGGLEAKMEPGENPSS